MTSPVPMVLPAAEPAAKLVAAPPGLPAPARLKLCCVTETYPPEVNGVATTLARLVDGLRQRHQVQLVRPRQPADVHDTRQTAAAPADRAAAGHWNPADVLVRGLPIPRYPQLRMGLPARRQLLRLWTQQRPDVVHIATEGPLGHSALQAALQLKLPVTSDFRTNFQAYSQHYGVGWLRRPILAYLRRFHNRCALTMVPTQPLRQRLEALGFERVAVVPRGVDTQLFSPQQRCLALRAQWGVAPDDLVVACVGRLAPEKNLGLVLQAFDAIAQAQPKARLLLVGDGPLRQALQARQPRALLVGQQTGQALARHYASADLFLFASLTETFGNVTAEAMASGLPVLAFDDAAAAQMVESGRSGCLVACGDAPGFIDQACRLASDAAWRVRCGQQARLRALAQDWSGIVQQVDAWLLHSLAHAQPLPGNRPGQAPQAGSDGLRPAGWDAGPGGLPR